MVTGGHFVKLPMAISLQRIVHFTLFMYTDAVKTLDAYEIEHLFSKGGLLVDLCYKEKEWNGRFGEISEQIMCKEYTLDWSQFKVFLIESWIHFDDALPNLYCRHDVIKPSCRIGPMLWFVMQCELNCQWAIDRFGIKNWKLSVFKKISIESSCICGVNAHISCCDPVHNSVPNGIEV